jgi:hypothetical protein
MPRTAIAVAVSTSKGVKVATPAASDTVNGNYLANSGIETFVAKNTGASARNVTIGFSATVDGQGVTSYVRSIPAGEEWEFGPFPVTMYGTQVAVDGAHAEVTLRASTR